jgi:hypothetical protein
VFGLRLLENRDRLLKSSFQQLAKTGVRGPTGAGKSGRAGK